MSSEQGSRIYFSSLDGVRGFASLLVITHHNFHYISILNYNQFGTDLFFVLSGFLITTLLLNTKRTKSALANFYMRRALRVFPLYYISLYIFLILLPKIDAIPLQFQYYKENQIWLWVFLQNWLYIFKDPNPFSALNHLWSMVIEEQFYLFWPLIIFILPKLKNLLAFVISFYILFIISRILIWFLHIEGLAYYNLFSFTKIDGLFIGCIVALLHNKQSNFINNHYFKIITTLAFFNLSFLAIDLYFNLGLPYFAFCGYISFSVLFGLLINFLIRSETRVFHRLFNIQLLKTLGKISYGTYIFHWPLYLLVSPMIKNLFSKLIIDSIATIIASIIMTFVAYLIGYLTFHLIEIKFLKLSRKHFK